MSAALTPDERAAQAAERLRRNQEARDRRAKADAARAAGGGGGGAAGAGDAASDGPDLAGLTTEQKVEALRRANLESIQRSVQLAHDADERGAATLTQLSMQREQLSNIQRNMDDINGNMTRSERILRGMKSLGGAIRNAFGKKPADETARPTRPDDAAAAAPPVAAAAAAAAADAAAGAAQSASNDAAASESGAAARGGSGKKGASEATVAAPARDAAAAEYDRAEREGLQQLSAALENLKVKAHAMGDELDQQNAVLQGLNDDVEFTTERVRRGNREINRILKS